jgi:hypothetical protein
MFDKEEYPPLSKDEIIRGLEVRVESLERHNERYWKVIEMHKADMEHIKELKADVENAYKINKSDEVTNHLISMVNKMKNCGNCGKNYGDAKVVCHDCKNGKWEHWVLG